MKAIDIIQSSIETHKQWAEWFEKYPEKEEDPEYIRLGGKGFHRECIKNYTEAIVEIDQLQSELAKYQAGNVPITQIIADNETMAMELEQLQTEIEKRSTNLDTQKVHNDIMKQSLRNGIEQAELLSEIERLKAELDEAIHDIILFQKQAEKLNTEIEQLQVENEMLWASMLMSKRAEKEYARLKAELKAEQDGKENKYGNAHQSAVEIIGQLKAAIKFIDNWLESCTTKGRPMDLMNRATWDKWQALKERK